VAAHEGKLLGMNHFGSRIRRASAAAAAGKVRKAAAANGIICRRDACVCRTHRTHGSDK
jgi:hypothetical protein